MGAHRRRQLRPTAHYEIYDLSASDTGLGQSPLRSPSVFNFFRPGYVPPNTAIATAGKQAPEFQLLNETTTAGYINFLQWVTRNGYNDVKPTYADAAAHRARRAAVVAWLNLRLTANQLSQTSLTVIADALDRVQHHRGQQQRRQARTCWPTRAVPDPHPRPNTWCRNEPKALDDDNSGPADSSCSAACSSAPWAWPTPLAINLAAIGEAAAFDSTDYKALVCVFLYGGNDYANTVVPYDPANYALYHQIRAGAGRRGRRRASRWRARHLPPTALTPAGGQALTDNLQYALAPQLAGLKSLWDQGRLAVQLNVGPLIQPTTLAQYQSTNSVRESAAAEAVLAQRPAVDLAVEWHRRLDHRLGRTHRRHRAVEQRNRQLAADLHFGVGQRGVRRGTRRAAVPDQPERRDPASTRCRRRRPRCAMRVNALITRSSSARARE